MIILSDGSRNAPLLKMIRPVPFQKYVIWYGFFDLKVHLLTSKPIKKRRSVLSRSRPAWNKILFALKVVRFGTEQKTTR